MKSQNTKSTY